MRRADEDKNLSNWARASVSAVGEAAGVNDNGDFEDVGMRKQAL